MYYNFHIIKKILLLISLTIFRICLDLSYIFFVSYYFNYNGFDLNINIFKYISSWVFVFIFGLLISESINKPSDYFFMMAGLSLLLPLTSLYGLGNKPIQPLLVTMLALIFINFILKIKNPLKIRPINVKNGQKVAFFISITAVIWLVIWYFYTGAYKYFNLNFSKVYEFRSASAELANRGLMAYISGWTYKVFIVFTLAYLLMKRHFGWVLLAIFVQIFYYGVSAHKSVLFTPFMVIGVWFYLTRFKTLLIMPLGFTCIILASYLPYLLFDNIMLPSMVIRRVFFVPAQLSFDYFNYFNKHDFIIWSNSIFSGLKSYPYELSLPKLIGEYNGSGASANNGFISSGYAHYGYIGVLIYSFTFGIILRLLNYATYYGLPLWFVLAMTITPLRDALISSDLFTTLLTHGLIVALILLLLSIDKRKDHNVYS